MTDVVRFCPEDSHPEVVRFAFRLKAYIYRQRAKWKLEDARKPPTREDLDNRWLWETMIEDTEWDRFYGYDEEAS